MRIVNFILIAAMIIVVADKFQKDAYDHTFYIAIFSIVALTIAEYLNAN